MRRTSAAPKGEMWTVERIKWRVTLFNQHLGHGIWAFGPTRRAAFDRAYHKAGSSEHRHHVLADRFGSTAGADVMWLAAFNDALAYMRRGTTSVTHYDPRGLCVEIRREGAP